MLELRNKPLVLLVALLGILPAVRAWGLSVSPRQLSCTSTANHQYVFAISRGGFVLVATPQEKDWPVGGAERKFKDLHQHLATPQKGIDLLTYVRQITPGLHYAFFDATTSRISSSKIDLRLNAAALNPLSNATVRLKIVPSLEKPSTWEGELFDSQRPTQDQYLDVTCLSEPEAKSVEALEQASPYGLRNFNLDPIATELYDAMSSRLSVPDPLYSQVFGDITFVFNRVTRQQSYLRASPSGASLTDAPWRLVDDHARFEIMDSLQTAAIIQLLEDADTVVKEEKIGKVNYGFAARSRARRRGGDPDDVATIVVSYRERLWTLASGETKLFCKENQDFHKLTEYPNGLVSEVELLNERVDQYCAFVVPIVDAKVVPVVSLSFPF